MKKILLCLLLGVLFAVTSCGIKTLKGSYPEKIHWRQSNSGFDRTYDKVVEVFVQEGYEVDRLDRQNGLIQFKTIIPGHLTTKEVNKKPKDPNMYVVYSPEIVPAITSMVTVLIRPNADKAIIGVKLDTWIYRPKGGGRIKYITASTGKFEETLIDIVLATGNEPFKK